MNNARKSCLPPVTDHRTTLLILGSLPGEQSLARAQYYAHPRNQFWRLIGLVIAADLQSEAYETRLQTLRDNGIGLWDSIATASRKGSLDTAIRDPLTNDLQSLINTLPHLRAIAFNGARSATLGTRALGIRALGPEKGPLKRLTLPSSSPAYTKKFDEKAQAWLMLKAFIPPFEQELLTDEQQHFSNSDISEKI